MCATLRQAMRSATRLYDRHLSKAGVRTTQYTTLRLLAEAGPMPQGRLADALAADATTLARTLPALQEEGVVRSEPGEDRRERVWSITPRGRAVLDRAKPMWERAQRDLRGSLEHRLGPTASGDALALVRAMAGAALDAERRLDAAG